MLYSIFSLAVRSIPGVPPRLGGILEKALMGVFRWVLGNLTPFQTKIFNLFTNLRLNFMPHFRPELNRMYHFGTFQYDL